MAAIGYIDRGYGVEVVALSDNDARQIEDGGVFDWDVKIVPAIDEQAQRDLAAYRASDPNW